MWFPLETTLKILGVFAVALILSHVIGRWWDKKKKR